jgi:hypothetical protein
VARTGISNFGEGMNMSSRMKTFTNGALAMACAALLCASGMAATSTSAYAADEGKSPRSGQASAPGQACREFKPGSAEFKACVAEHAKKDKKPKKAKADTAKGASAKKAEQAKKAKVDTAKRGSAKKAEEVNRSAVAPAPAPGAATPR